MQCGMETGNLAGIFLSLSITLKWSLSRVCEGLGWVQWAQKKNQLAGYCNYNYECFAP
jgi:hypothetical protein